MGQDEAAADGPRPQELDLVGAVLVDRAEDHAVAVGDAFAGAVVLAAHGHEIGVLGERLGERVSVAGVPGSLQPADDVARGHVNRITQWWFSRVRATSPR